jgi:branched-subunit amino acid permease
MTTLVFGTSWGAAATNMYYRIYYGVGSSAPTCLNSLIVNEAVTGTVVVYAAQDGAVLASLVDAPLGAFKYNLLAPGLFVSCLNTIDGLTTAGNITLTYSVV